MSREYKFRGYSTIFKEWKYGYLVNGRSTSSIIEIYGDIFYGVVPESVGQFTGLKDKKGKEIYEGDIGEIRTQSGRVERFVVKWGIHRRDMKSGWTVDIPGFCFYMDGFPSFPIANNYNNGHDLDIIEIIGNIHEHPSLLNPQP